MARRLGVSPNMMHLPSRAERSLCHRGGGGGGGMVAIGSECGRETVNAWREMKGPMRGLQFGRLSRQLVTSCEL